MLLYSLQELIRSLRLFVAMLAILVDTGGWLNASIEYLARAVIEC